MALSFIIRRASSPVLHLAIQAIGCRRSFHGAVSTALNTCKRTKLSQAVSLQFFRLSSSTTKPIIDHQLIQAISSEISSSNMGDIPSCIPFSIQDYFENGETILLTRVDSDETIEVEVYKCDLQDIAKSSRTKNIAKSSRRNWQFRFPMVVRISKGGFTLELKIMTSSHQISIDNFSIKKKGKADKYEYDGPGFWDPGSDLQLALRSYLEIRGIEPSLVDTLLKYKRQGEVQCLKKLQRFIRSKYLLV